MWHSTPVLMDEGVVVTDSRFGKMAPTPSVGRLPSPSAAWLSPVRRKSFGTRPSCSAFGSSVGIAAALATVCAAASAAMPPDDPKLPMLPIAANAEAGVLKASNNDRQSG